MELAGLPPVAPEALRDLLAAEGLAPMGSHEGLAKLRDDLDGVLDRLSVVGCPRAIVPWMPEEDRTTPEAVRALARELNGIADACRDRGIRLGYHNHAFEFAPLGGTTVWDILLDELDPSVELELDVYWAAYAGRDPVELARSMGERLRLLHMKDMAERPQGGDVVPGDGVLPWPAIVRAGTELGVEWYVVEEDNPSDAVAEIARGLRYLQGLAEGARV